MEPINLDPRYSTRDIPGKCVKCLAEKELDDCLMALLREEGEDTQLQQKFEALVSFLKSPESQKLRDESEKLLSEGKNVRVVLHLEEQEPRYEIKLD